MNGSVLRTAYTVHSTVTKGNTLYKYIYFVQCTSYEAVKQGPGLNMYKIATKH